MFTIESLKRGYYLSVQEKRIEDRIRAIDEALTNISPSQSETHGAGAGDKMGRLIAEKVDLINDLVQLKSVHNRVDYETKQDIAEVDEYNRQILYERFIELKTWAEIGEKRNQSEDAMRIRANRIVKSQGHL